MDMGCDIVHIQWNCISYFISGSICWFCASVKLIYYLGGGLSLDQSTY